jgi:RHS repeat-associated protein
VSAALAIAEPRRIKATHRRRRKIAAGRFVQRYYDPGIGRFLSVDPVTANDNTGGNFNRYWYANNNPFRFTDPDGRLPKGPDTPDVINPEQPPECNIECKRQKQAERNAKGNGVYGDFSGQVSSAASSSLDLLTTPWGGWEGFKYSLTCIVTCGLPGDGSLEGQFAAFPMVAMPETLVVKTGGIVFKTGHYADRLTRSGVSVAQAQKAVAKAVRVMRPNMLPKAPISGRITVGGVLVEYRVYLLNNGTVNVGSIFPVILVTP